MKLGVIPPYFGPAVVEPDWVRGFCLALEAEGVESVWPAEHVVIPATYGSEYPYSPDGRMPLRDGDPFPDPLEWIAFAAGATRTLVFGTAVLILPEHNPVHLAKRLATIDALSGGRVRLGVGVGWLQEEFDALGVPFERRGARADEYIAALRMLWTGEVVSFDGEFVRFTEVTSRPAPPRPVPIIIGGNTPATARRAGRLGDGYHPFGVSPAEIRLLLDVMRKAALDAGRDPDAIELTTSSPRDADTVAELADLGVSRLVMPARPDPDPSVIRAAVGRYRERVRI